MKRIMLASLFTLAACQSGPGGTQSISASGPSAGDDPCGAGKFASLVGKPAGNISQSTFPAGARVLRPGMVMTMDYRAERLNVVIDDSGKVDRIYCG